MPSGRTSSRRHRRRRIPRERLGPLLFFRLATRPPVRMPSPDGTLAPTAAFRGFRSHRLQATTHERRNDMGQYGAHRWTYLIRRRGKHTELSTARGNHGQRSLCPYASRHSTPRRERSGPGNTVTAVVRSQDASGLLARIPQALPRDAPLKDGTAPLEGATGTKGMATQAAGRTEYLRVAPTTRKGPLSQVAIFDTDLRGRLRCPTSQFRTNHQPQPSLQATRRPVARPPPRNASARRVRKRVGSLR